MTLTQLKPAKDAAFFEQIAQISEHMLLTAAMTFAVRKDFVSLNGLVDFLAQRGREVALFVDHVEMPVCIPRNATDTRSPGREREDGSMALAFAIALGTRDLEKGIRFLGATPPEALALAQRIGEIYPKEHASPQTMRPLDVLLHRAAGHVTDRGVLQALVAAGADAGCKLKCTQEGIDTQTLPVVEALLHHNLASATALLAMTPAAAVKTLVESCWKSKSKTNKSPADVFSNATGIVPLVNGLHLKADQVGAFLEQIDAKMAEAGKPLEAARFRLFMANTYLRVVANRKCDVFQDKQMLAIFGEPGDAVHQGLNRLLDAFAEMKNPNTGRNPELDKWRSSQAFMASKNHFELIEAEFLYQAVRTHCTRALEISKPVLTSAVTEGGPALAQALDGNMPQTSDSANPWTFNVQRFKQTLRILGEAGMDPNALPGGSNALHALAKSKSKDLLEMMPVVLALVEKPSALNDAQQTPLDVLKKSHPKDTEAHGRWESIVKSHAARHSALNLIDEIEMQEQEEKRPMP